MVTFNRDITQAYIQSDCDLEREVYITATSEMKLPKDTVLKVVRPLYGFPESGLHLCLTCLDHHTERIKMKRTKTDPCVLIRHNEGKLAGLVILQVDESLRIGTMGFMEEEEIASKPFKEKRTMLTKSPITFNGSNINLKKMGVTSP